MAHVGIGAGVLALDPDGRVFVAVVFVVSVAEDDGCRGEGGEEGGEDDSGEVHGGRLDWGIFFGGGRLKVRR